MAACALLSGVDNGSNTDDSNSCRESMSFMSSSDIVCGGGGKDRGGRVLPERWNQRETENSQSKGISNYYSGQAKFFRSLAESSASSSIKDLAKPDNPYNRKCKISLAHSNFSFKNQGYAFRNSGRSGVQKRPVNSSQNALPSTNCSNANNFNTMSTLPSCVLSPVYTQRRIPEDIGASTQPRWWNLCWSLSLADLQAMAAPMPDVSALAIHHEDKDKIIG